MGTLDTQTPERASKTLCEFQKVLRRTVRGSVYRVHRNTLLVGQLRASWTHKPLNRLLRILSRSQKVLRRPVRGFPYTGYTEMLSKFRDAQGESDHFREILENLDMLEILEMQSISREDPFLLWPLIWFPILKTKHAFSMTGVPDNGI